MNRRQRRWWNYYRQEAAAGFVLLMTFLFVAWGLYAFAQAVLRSLATGLQ